MWRGAFGTAAKCAIRVRGTHDHFRNRRDRRFWARSRGASPKMATRSSRQAGGRSGSWRWPMNSAAIAFIRSFSIYATPRRWSGRSQIFRPAFAEIDVLVNNAGLALGLEPASQEPTSKIGR